VIPLTFLFLSHKWRGKWERRREFLAMAEKGKVGEKGENPSCIKKLCYDFLKAR